MRFVKPFLGKDFLEILIAAQAPSHRTPSKARKPTFPQGIPVYVGCVGEICAQETFVPSKLRRGSAAIYRSGMTGIRSHQAIVGPFRFLDFGSCDFYQVFAVIRRRVT